MYSTINIGSLSPHEFLPAESVCQSHGINKIEVIPNIMFNCVRNETLYTIEYCISRINRFILSSNL